MKIVITIDPELNRFEQLQVIQAHFWTIISKINNAEGKVVQFELPRVDGKKAVVATVKAKLKSAPPWGERTFRTISVKEEKKRAKKARKQLKKELGQS